MHQHASRRKTLQEISFSSIECSAVLGVSGCVGWVRIRSYCKALSWRWKVWTRAPRILRVDGGQIILFHGPQRDVFKNRNVQYGNLDPHRGARGVVCAAGVDPAPLRCPDVNERCMRVEFGPGTNVAAGSSAGKPYGAVGQHSRFGPGGGRSSGSVALGRRPGEGFYATDDRRGGLGRRLFVWLYF